MGNIKISLLTKPTWTRKDIMDYFSVSSTKAYSLMSKMRRTKQKVQSVNVDTFLDTMFGTSRKKELEILLLAKEVEEKVNE